MKYLMTFILSVIVGISGFLYFMRDVPHCSIFAAGEEWSFEVAKTPLEQTRGLMGRTHLCKNCGMIFVFQTPGPKGFWMKNTPLALDMYFYDSNGMLVDRALNMSPDNYTDPPMQYISQKSVKYVIEVEQGSGFYTRKLDFRHCTLN